MSEAERQEKMRQFIALLDLAIEQAQMLNQMIDRWADDMDRRLLHGVK